MEREKANFERDGLRVAALTYDSQALLADFARRKQITYPLLADSDSTVIRAFDILNDNFPKDHPWFGVPFPGTYVIGGDGVVKSKYFEEDHRDRFTAATVRAKISPQSAGLRSAAVETPHMRILASASDEAVGAGSRVELRLQARLKPKMHVYAPGVQPSYKPIAWTLSSSPAWTGHPVVLPAAKTLRLEAIDETVPVYAGSFEIARDVTIGQSEDLRSVLAGGREIVVRGELRYQACDDRQCFPPVSVPLEWSFRYVAHDGQRAPEPLRRKERAQ